jgi:RNA polymerase sigma-70 factor (ECF subfamily)
MAPPVLDPDGNERDPAEYLPSLGPSPEAQVLSAERQRQLTSALSQLPERQRMVFVLSHFEGRSSREVSAATGLNESTVRVHLFRAVRRLRGLLTGRAGGRPIKGKTGRSNRAAR